MKLRTVEQMKEDKMTSLPPALEHLWAFSCELTIGWNINSMSLNKMDQVTLKYHTCCCFLWVQKQMLSLIHLQLSFCCTLTVCFWNYAGQIYLYGTNTSLILLSLCSGCSIRTSWLWDMVSWRGTNQDWSAAGPSRTQRYIHIYTCSFVFPFSHNLVGTMSHH